MIAASTPSEPQRHPEESTGSFEWEIAADRITLSEGLQRILGIESKQFEDTFEGALARIHRDDRDTTRSVLLDAFRTQSAVDYEHRIVRPDGSVRTLHTHGDFVKDRQGSPVRMVGMSWDITDRAQALAERQRSLSLLEATLEATADGIMVVDRTGKVVLVNQRLLSMWSLSPERDDLNDEAAILGRMLAQVEDPDGFRAGVLAFAGRPEAERADEIRLRDGRVFERYSRPQRVGASVDGRVWCYRDVSEREQLLHRALFLADATRLLGSLDVERALEAVAHLIVRDLGDACAFDLLHEGALRRVAAATRDPARAISPDIHPSVLSGHAVRYRSGSISQLGVPIAVKGTVIGALTMAAAPGRDFQHADMDLAVHLARRAALAVENTRLYRSTCEAVRARDEFLSIAAHEIRGPVGSLHLAVQMLQSGRVDETLQRKAFEIIERQDRRLAQFVDELLDLSRIRTGGMSFSFETVDLAQTVREVTTRLAPELARAGSRLSLESTGPVRGQWDRFRLDQVVTNLLSNAIKFGLGRPIRIEVSAERGIARLVVEDHGTGIAPELKERIFRPFERGVSVRHYGGLGLGLYIVKTIVETMNGSVRVESTPGGGATFTVELPQERP